MGDIIQLIFRDGAKVLNQEAIDFVKKFKNKPTLNLNQRDLEIKSDYEIYGDDFKIEIEGSHGESIFVLKDYDEFQNLEYKTVITFDKKEISQLIAVLKSVRDKM